jgi:hypothetical protein
MTVQSDRKIPSGPYPTDDEIAQRVYEMFLERNWTSGSPDFWSIAEAELLDRAATGLSRRDGRGQRGGKP